MKIGDLAVILRSKNAGIGHVTIDMLFADETSYQRASRAVTPQAVALAYGVTQARISDIVYFEEGQAIKVTFVRGSLAGGEGLGDADVYGSGQFAPMAEIPVPSD